MARVSPEYVILGLLEARSCHGYELMEHFRVAEKLGNIWKLSTSRIYALLKRLENQQLIDGREEDATDAPMRTVYWLTPQGYAVLFDWLEDPEPSASTRNIRTEFLSRLYIARVLDLPTEAIITAQHNACLIRLDRMESQIKLKPGSIGSLAIELQIAEMKVIIEWIETCRKQAATAGD